MRYYLTLVRMAIIKKRKGKITRVGEDVKKRKHFHTVDRNMN